MSQEELLKRVVHHLESVPVNYMVTGSMASSLQGEPRSTHDIDIVVALRPANVRAFLRCFPEPDFYFNEDAVVDAVLHGGHFNIIEISSGAKVDFWMLEDSPFDASRFRRRTQQKVFGEPVVVTTPEDTILKKLDWCEASGGSQKQFDDAKGIYEVQFSKLDLAYVEYWAEILQITPLWEKLKAESKPLRGGQG